MAKLTTADLKLIDSLFGMYGGYVMDFSNSRFASFFERDVGVNIYDDAYAIHGTSKGKRLRGFLEIAQTAAIIRALHALWDYREVSRLAHSQAETVDNARQRLSAVIEKLGGQPLAMNPDEGLQDAKTGKLSRPSVQALVALEEEFMAMHAMDDKAQARGYAFERFLRKWFDAWGLDARGSFKLLGEQIDGSFLHEGSVYLIEAKWRNQPTDASTLRSFQEKVGDRLEGARGLFISYSGFTADGLQAFTARRVVMMDGMDVYEALRRRIPLNEVVAAKLRVAIEERRPFVHVRELFP
ncbi:hypothetical protein HDIA_4834 [Hartmannibacter diazotrophicus]|uniref:Uncharacterized protein n=1 Tax=Hartmannibacter diazotrophicus TaxID=1482074 RepID=A0A2C9DEF3_9HYPH|nr:restriction endonuclease [Hartmannibacter diazotrophicus]SON58375.1 hypothetical protein HDIA_4834 [Hartmannibacter diazotrophicus]